jgi:hypothetical protein
MRFNFFLFLGIAFIAFWVIKAAMLVGSKLCIGTIVIGWDLPVSIFSVLVFCFYIGYLVHH